MPTKRTMALISKEAKRHYRRAVRLWVSDDLPEALQEVQEAIRLSPECAEFHRGLASVLLRQGRDDEAAEVLREALRLDPTDLMTYSELGIILERTGRVDEAIVRYQEGLRALPQNGDLLFALGNALHDAGRVEEAITAFREGGQVDDDYSCHNNLACLLAEENRLDEAVEAYEEAVRRAPDAIYLRVYFGDVLVKAGRLEEAERTYREATALKSEPELWKDQDSHSTRAEVAEAHCHLARLLKETGRQAEAIQHLREGLRLDSRDGELLCKLGDAFHELGYPDEAHAAWEQAAGLDDPEAAEQARARLTDAR
jgi:protein O-GlcNAc transferase